MQVQRIQSNYNNRAKLPNYNKKQNILNNSEINFLGSKQKLVSISANSFKSDCAKSLYSKIQRYFQLIGDIGSIKEVKLMHEKMHDFSSKPPYIFNVDADVCLSINKGDRNSNIKLFHRYSNPKKKDGLMLNALIDKNGQMVRGEFFPENLLFERNGKNVRRMYSNSKGDNYLPVGNNDREWCCPGSSKLLSEKLIDDSDKAALEIFIELARLKTSII